MSTRLPWLRRVAYLLCQEWQGADDLVQVVITRLYTHWGRARAAASVDAYARTVLVRAFLAGADRPRRLRRPLRTRRYLG